MSHAWPMVPLGEIVAGLEAGVSVNGFDEQVGNDSEVGVLKVSCVSQGRFLAEQNKKVVPSDLERVAVSPRMGDIVISRANTLELVGASGYVTKDHKNLFLSDKLWRVRLKTEGEDSSRWLIALLNSDELRRELLRRATGTSGSMKNIGKESFLAIRVPRPKKEIQVALGEVFRRFEDCLFAIEQLCTARRTFKRGLMQQLLTGRKRFPEFRSGAWDMGRFDSLCEELSDRNGKRLSADSVMGVIKGIGFEPMREKVRGKGDLSKYKLVPPGAFAYNPMRLNIGSIAYNTLDREILVSPDYEVFRARDGVAEPEFINQLRYSWYWSSFMKRAGAGSVRVRIYFQDLARLRVPTPSAEEQATISATLRLANTEIDQLSRLRELIEVQKRGLLSRLLSGELQVPA